jgi:hypothetical protein
VHITILANSDKFKIFEFIIFRTNKMKKFVLTHVCQAGAAEISVVAFSSNTYFGVGSLRSDYQKGKKTRNTSLLTQLFK